MKTIKLSTGKKVVIAAVILIILAVAGVIAFRANKVTTLVHEKNYIASKLIENGLYTKGSILATQSEQTKANDTSKILIVLGTGMNEEYDIALLYADTYLEKSNSKNIQEAKDVLVNYQEQKKALEEAEVYDNESYAKLQKNTYDDLLRILLEVQKKIPVKESDATLLAIAEYMSGISDSMVMEKIEDSNSLLAQEVQAEHAIATGNYEKAIEKMESLVDANATFEYKAKMANMVVQTGFGTEEDKKTQELRKEQTKVIEKYNKLNTELNEETDSIKKGQLEEQIEKLEAEIQALQDEIRAIPAQKAINYIKGTTSIIDKRKKAYDLELAQLHYYANEKEEAKEIMLELIQDEDKSLDVVNVIIQTFKEAYLNKNIALMQVLWVRVEALLGFETSSITDSGFYVFVKSIFEDVYHGLIIREINTENYPVVRVTLNVATTVEGTLKKSDISLEDLGKGISGFKLIPAAEAEVQSEVAVELVIDRSGSMEGSPMEDTKKAVNNFISTLSDNIQLGVVAFDNMASVITPISKNHRESMQGVNSLVAMGGTSIYSGLKLAGAELENYSGRKIIILMSDGQDGTPIDDVLEELNRKNIYVYTIGFGGADSTYLSYIAEKCGGKFIQADSSEMLKEIYVAVGEYMMNDYILEFTAKTDIDNFDRNLKITLNENGIFVEPEYHIGVSLEEIQAEDGLLPWADYFQQIGGSDTNPQP